MAYISCPKCGAQCEEQDAFCNKCGFELASLKRCEECGAVLDPRDTVCRSCGIELVPQKRCTECGAVIDPQDTICRNCGCPTTLPAAAPQPIPMQQPVQQYAQLPPQRIAAQPPSGGVAARIMALLAVLLFAVSPCLKLYSSVIDTNIATKKWSFSVFDFFDKAEWVSDVYEPISKVVSAASDYLPGVSSKFAELDKVESVVMAAAWISVILLALCYITLLGALIDIASNAPDKITRFWSRISGAMGFFLLYTFVMLGFLLLANAYIGSLIDSSKLAQIVADVLKFDTDVFKISGAHYAIQAAGVVVYGLARAKYKRSRLVR